MDPAKQPHDATKLLQTTRNAHTSWIWITTTVRDGTVHTHYILQLPWVYLSAWSNFAIYGVVFLSLGVV